MHSVPRTPEPDFLPLYRLCFGYYGLLDHNGRGAIRRAPKVEFGRICPYCERKCSESAPPGFLSTREVNDHFRPRSRFPHLSLDWDNLVYSCERCNERRADCWPGFDDASLNERLRSKYPRYVVPPSYVSPSLGQGDRPGRDFFIYDFETGGVYPSPQLDALEWSMAQRTIVDFDLNDAHIPRRYSGAKLLRSRRRDHVLRVARLAQAKRGGGPFDVLSVSFFAHPSMQFSGIAAAYLRSIDWDLSRIS